ncbi:MAG: RNA methyltransferase, partial [Actinomycetota bacterium]
PMPIAAVASWPALADDDLLADERPILVAVELRDPGNLGTIIRTAEAAGLAGVLVTGASVDRFSPKVVRASAGSLFRLPVMSTDDPVGTVAMLQDRGRPVVAAVVASGAVPYDHQDLSGAAILLGNEPHGLPAEVVAAVDRPVTIPMAPGVESLNVAAAASVLCFEAARQRRQAGETTRNPVDSHRSDAHGVHNDCTELT